MKGSVTIPVGGELESRATDGVIVSADGVYDYVQGKMQEVINQEVLDGQLLVEDSWDNRELDDEPTVG